MIHRYGIDTSILVRLTSGDPPQAFQSCLQSLLKLVDGGQVELLVSNQVIGESYVALQHHYGVTKEEARSALRESLSSGLVRPQNGIAVLEILQDSGGCGLLDRLISQDYTRGGLLTLTLDKRMGRLKDCQTLDCVS